jgi:hypothetical protein
MALVSPGVQVNVIDESFYTPAEPGTVPLIFIATKQNKRNPAGTGIAPGTLAANAEKLYLISSQRELSETFGDATFYTDANNNPIHGGEQNEYGLQAAYSFLGVSNRAYVIRADIDLGKLDPSAVAPGGTPVAGSHWFDVAQTRFGVFEWDGRSGSVTGGQTFGNKIPTVITDITRVDTGNDNAPKASVGAIGDYAIVAVTDLVKLWYKNTENTWVLVGSAEWSNSWPTLVGTATPPSIPGPTEVIVINGVTVNTSGATLDSLVSAINGNVTLQGLGIRAANLSGSLALFSTGVTITIDAGSNAGLLTALGVSTGTYLPPALVLLPHTQVPQWKLTGTGQSPRPTGSIWVKTTTPNAGADWSVKRYNSALSAWERIPSPLHANGHTAIARLDPTGGGLNLSEGDLYVKTNVGEGDNNPDRRLATFKIFRRSASGATVIRSVPITTTSAGIYDIFITSSQVGSATLPTAVKLENSPGDDELELNGNTADAEIIAAAINAANVPNVVAEVDSQNRVVVRHTTGGEIRFTEASNNGTLLESLFTSNTNFYVGENDDEFVASLWIPLLYVPSIAEPLPEPDNGELWFSSVIDEIDIMVHNGTTWVGYQSLYGLTSATGPVVSASEPVGSFVDDDLWISTADIENFPIIYRYRNNRWNLVDKTDQTSENGVLFADARYNTSGANSDRPGSIEALLESNYLDPDAPDPALFPRGMLLWNLRRSGFNVKRFVKGYIDVNQTNPRFGNESMGSYFADRWVTESRNNDDGSGSFGSNAQRKVIVQRLQAMINSNQDIRDDESRLFNLMACPNYPELINEMISLNFDRGLTAFIVGDSPLKLEPNTTSINNWANNINLALEDSIDGLVSRDEYLGVYYPAGFTSDNAGNNVVVPASHMVLRTIALNDQVAYPWFAPAGTRRGGVTNATATGFINREGEFVSVALNEGQRDTLYQANVNPITFITGSGLVIFGQKTRARNASALDRINVARLVIFLRRQLNTLAKPYLFEPNDKITRDEIKAQVEALLVELVGLRALYDYLVVCDESNNTPSRIDRNELYVDIAIEPVKAVEFIYIPLRLKNTGEIAGL